MEEVTTLVLAGTQREARDWLHRHPGQSGQPVTEATYSLAGHGPNGASVERVGTWYERPDWPEFVHRLAYIEQRSIAELDKERLDALWKSRQNHSPRQAVEDIDFDNFWASLPPFEYKPNVPPLGREDVEAIFNRGKKRYESCPRLCGPYVWLHSEVQVAQMDNDRSYFVSSTTSIECLVIACMNKEDTDDVRLGIDLAQAYLNQYAAYGGMEPWMTIQYERLQPEAGEVLHTPEYGMWVWTQQRNWLFVMHNTPNLFKPITWILPGYELAIFNLSRHLRNQEIRITSLRQELVDMERAGCIRTEAHRTFEGLDMLVNTRYTDERFNSFSRTTPGGRNVWTRTALREYLTLRDCSR
jgi:hypothetical protein